MGDVSATDDTFNMVAAPVEVKTEEVNAVPNYGSMIADHNNLYVINFKDTILSVYNINDLKLVTTWEIPTSSHGLHLVDNELWVGGHGAGSQANKVISKYNIQSGELQGEMEAPMMPIDFADASDGLQLTEKQLRLHPSLDEDWHHDHLYLE